MFTGLVEMVGTCIRTRNVQGGRELIIECGEMVKEIETGDSISVNGACLTVTTVGESEIAVFAGLETLGRTNLGNLRTGYQVNLERALKLGDRLGGHLVNGHVDGVVRVAARDDQQSMTVFRFFTDASLMPYIAEKGSVTVQGVSLTVSDKKKNSFSVSVIPHTMKSTTLSGLKPGMEVNLEVDILAKYVENMVSKKGSGKESLLHLL